MLDWDNLRVFLAAVRAGNYTAAAKRLRVDRTTVGRKLERLEHQIDTTLFQQGDDGYHPTSAGKRALEVAHEIERLVEGLVGEIGGLPARKDCSIRVSVAAELGPEFMPELAAFASAHPSTRIMVRSSSSPANDIIARKCDLGICLADRKPDHLRGRLIAPLYQTGYASRQYLDKRGHGLAPQDYDWVRCASFSPLPTMRRWEAIFCDSVSVTAYVDGWAALLAAVEQGLGAAFLWTFVGDRHADLVRIAPLDETVQVGLWLLVRDDVPMEWSTRLLLDNLSEQLGKRVQVGSIIDPAFEQKVLDIP